MDYVEGYYKFKGVNVKDYKADDLKKLLGKALAFNIENMSNVLTIGDMA